MKKSNLTIPNIISVIRILIIPFFVYYFLNNDIQTSIILLLLSGLSDAVDGFIARTFNQITELGKILDPLADKMTQIVIAFCFAIKFPILIPFMMLFLAKECSMIFLASGMLTKNKKPCAAKWYGKVSTVLFYISVSTIVYMDIQNFSRDTFLFISIVLLSLTSVMMIYSAFSYFKIFQDTVKSDREEDRFDFDKEIKGKNS